MTHKVSALTRAAIMIAVLGAAGAVSTPVFAGAQSHAIRTVTCQTGGSYTRLRFSPAPMAVFGSLQAGKTTTFSAQPLNGKACVAGVTVWININPHVSGDSLAPQNPSQCGGTTSIGSSYVGCTTDSNGNVPLVYTAPSTLPDTGVVEVNVLNAQQFANISGHTWYLYEMLYKFSASPIAHSGTLTGGQQVTDTLTASGGGGNPEQNMAVWLSFTSSASSPGSASVGGTPLNSSRRMLTTDSNGQVSIVYTAPGSPPTTGIDTISAWSSPASTPAVFNSTSYVFSSTEPTISIGDVAGVEGDGAGANDPKGKGTYAEFDVTLSAPSASPTTVSYFSICGVGDKTCQEDYLQTSSTKPHTITIPAGSVRGQINVVIYSYPAIEAYPETYWVQLFNPTSNAVLGRSVGNGTIIQDDETATGSGEVLYVGDTAVVRGTSGTQFAEFTVTLSLSPSSPVTFQYTTANGTASAGTDYSATSGTATINPGSTSAHLQVPILPTSSSGSTLTFTMTISSPSGAAIDRAVGTGSVLNWN
jgi:hypothetical protein